MASGKVLDGEFLPGLHVESDAASLLAAGLGERANGREGQAVAGDVDEKQLSVGNNELH